MTDHTTAAQAADTNPLSDEYVNAVIQQHGYDSPESVIAQLHQWIGLHGGEDSVTLLMYEAHKALVKLRAPVADIPRAIFALEHIAAWAGTRSSLKTHKDVRAYAKHNAALASAPVADERECGNADCGWRGTTDRMCGSVGPLCPECGETTEASAPVADKESAPTVPHDEEVAEAWVTASDGDGIAYDGLSFERGYRVGEIAACSRAPVAGEAQPAAWKTDNGIRPTVDHRVAEVWRKQGWKVTPLYDHAAPQTSEEVRLIGIDLAANGIAQVRRDTLLSVLGVLNSNPYNLTKSECVDLVHGMFAKAGAALSAQPGAQKDGGAAHG